MSVGGLSGAGVLRAALASAPAPLALQLPDGSVMAAGPPGPPVCTVVVRSPRAVACLFEAPSILTLGEAFLAGDLEVEGDLCTAGAVAYSLEPAPRGPEQAPPLESGHEDDRTAIAFHYDLPSDFYALFLDPRMVYTCAIYPDAEADLARAQETKLELVCQKLRLSAGERFLDIGCGWGGLVRWAAEHHGVNARGVTFSAAQASWAEKAIGRGRLAHRARVDHIDFRDLARGAMFDKIASLGLIEHLGPPRYPEYVRTVREHLVPGGLLLTHAITHPHPDCMSSGMTFLSRHVFPGGMLGSVAQVLDALIAGGFDIVHIEGFGPHYARTTADWLARLETHAVSATRLVGDRTCRTFRLYLAAASVAFRSGWIDVHQVLARRPA